MAKLDRYATRRRRIETQFRKEGIDGLLVTEECNVRYLSGFTGGDSALLVRRGGAFLLTDGRYDEQAGQETRGIEICVRKKSMAAFAARMARNADVSVMGVEADVLSLTEYKALIGQLGKTACHPTNGLVEGLRMIKDRHEVAAISQAARIAQEAFLATIAELRPGRTEIEIARMLDRAMEDMGAEAPGFPTIVAAGKRTSLPHAQPTYHKIRKGDTILFDWGARVEGYHSDLTRLVFLDRIPQLFKRLYESVLGAQRQAITRMRPGCSAGSVDASVRAELKARRLNRYFTHGLGHGLGLKVHEAPVLGAKGQVTLRPGMVCTVEPGVYLPGRGGVRIEDDVLITRTGQRLLTSLPKTLDAFPLRSP